MKLKVAITIICLSVVLCAFSGIQVFADAVSFSDLDAGSDIARAAEYLSENGILTGYPDGTFRKDNTITRAELCTMLCRVLDMGGQADEQKGQKLFSDLDGNHWANGYINAAYGKNIVNGYADKSFKPDANVRTEEAVKMIICLMYDQEEFTQKTPWYQCYIDKANEIGLLDGTSCRIGEEITRGETALLLYNAYTWFGGKYTVSFWDFENAVISRDFIDVSEDKFSYRLESVVENDIRVMYTVPVEPDATYVINLKMKTEDVVNVEKGNERVGANVSTGDYHYSFGGLGTQDWHTVRVIGKADSEGNLLISLNLGYWLNTSSGRAWFENVRYQKIDDFDVEDHTWKFLWVVAKNIDVDYYDEQRKETVKEKSSLPEDKIEKTKAIAREFESVLAEQTDGKIIPKVDVIVLEEPITELDRYGETSYYLSNANASALLKKAGIDSSEYDHVAVVTKFNDIPADEYWGLGGIYLDDYTGYSFVRHLGDEYRESLNYDVLWHEFLHSLENRAGFYMGYDVPGLHDYEKYGYSDFNDEWYTDYINCRVRNCRNEYHGIPGFILNIKPTLFN